MKLPKLPGKPLEIISSLHKAGFQCYAVGGCVRDLLLNRPTHDWDFTTNATPDEILKIFPDNSFYENIFGTVGLTVTGESGQEETYEVTTYRSEQGYSDRRHPDQITWGVSLEEDLGRRDFTINAIAYDGNTLVDRFGGRDDLKKKTVRAVGEPEQRFWEDALRLMRAIRIATQLAFFIDEKTAAAIRKNTALIEIVSAERVSGELFKILESDHPADGILLLKNHDLLYRILPEMEGTFETEQKSPQRHHIYDVGTHLVESLRHCPSPNKIVRLATLLHDIGKPATYNQTKDGVITFYNHEIISASKARHIAHRLRLSKKDAGLLIRLVRWHQFSVDENQTDSAIRRIIRNIGKENLQDMLDLRVGDRLGGGAKETSWRLELFKKRLEEVQKQPFSITDLKINGHDVMKELNLQPGPEVGKILKQLFEEVVNKKIENEKKVLLTRLKTLTAM